MKKSTIAVIGGASIFIIALFVGVFLLINMQPDNREPDSVTVNNTNISESIEINTEEIMTQKRLNLLPIFRTMNNWQKRS